MEDVQVGTVLDVLQIKRLPQQASIRVGNKVPISVTPFTDLAGHGDDYFLERARVAGQRHHQRMDHSPLGMGLPECFKDQSFTIFRCFADGAKGEVCLHEVGLIRIM